MRPDSFTPRRLITMMANTSVIERATRCANSAGYADASCATPDETDTETVRM